MTTSEPVGFGEIISDALGYWERRRVGYNLVLGAIVVGWVVLTWPRFRGALTWSSLLALFGLAVLANACYCAAYLVDIPVQYSSLRVPWRRRRGVLWALGVVV